MNRNTTLSSLIWRFIERIGAHIVTFIVSIILARLLDPEVYGTIAIITVFITIMQVFVDSGLGNALIQKKSADDLDFSSVFYFNLIICCLLYAIMFFAAPLIGKFYDNMELIPVIRVLSLTLVISGVRNVQQAYVFRNMLFKKLFLSSIVGTIGAAVVGIGMAYKGYGIWALVGQQLFNVLVGTIILWFVVKWRPKLIFSFERLKGLFSFGWKLLASALIETLYNNLRSLIIGKVYSPSKLAYYDKGNQFPFVIISNINTSIDSVLLPTMSREQDNSTRIKSMIRRAIRTSTYIMAPMMIGLAVCAEPIVTLLLTDKWLPCVLFMRIFCVTYIFYPIHTANLNAVKAMGRSDIFLKLEIVKKIVGFSAILATMWISVEAMAYSLLITTVLSTMINAFPNKKLLNYSWFEQMRDILPNICLSVIMGIPVYLIQYLPLPNLVILILQVITGVIIYMGLSMILKLEMFNYLIEIVKDFTKKGKLK